MAHNKKKPEEENLGDVLTHVGQALGIIKRPAPKTDFPAAPKRPAVAVPSHRISALSQSAGAGAVSRHQGRRKVQAVRRAKARGENIKNPYRK